jgi:hypothetical protein
VVLTKSANPDVFLRDFSLHRTLATILATTMPGKKASDVTDAQIESFLESLLLGLRSDQLTNIESGLTFRVQPRTGEAALSAHALLTPDDPNEMLPVALFNRLDLAPADFSNCGEFRIVYAKRSVAPDGTVPQATDRLTLIFEAALTNPDPSGGAAACQSVYRLWKSFSAANPDGTVQTSDAQIGAMVDNLYYVGGPIDGSAPFEPVLYFRHFGLPSGQVRANAFVRQADLPWHLRQWRVIFDANTPTIPPVFEPRPVSENPVPGLFGGDDPDGVEPAGSYAKIKGFFYNEFSHTNVAQLTAVDRDAAIPVAPNATAADLIDNLGVDVRDQFYAVESAAGPPTGTAPDDPAPRAMGSQLAVEVEKRLGKLREACGVTAEHIFNRMGAMTCGGCHQFSNGKTIAPGIRWPKSLKFVHINERGEMSDLLLDRFLPFRFHLMDTLPGPPIAPPAPPSPAMAARTGSNLQLQRKQLRLQEILARPRDNRDAIVSGEIRSLTDDLRRSEKAQPGAFVTIRKPD